MLNINDNVEIEKLFKTLDIDISENENNKKNLIESIKNREVVLFVGAGLSKQAGYPTWGELLTDMKKHVEEYYQKDIDAQENKFKFALELKKCFNPQNAYIKFIQSKFKGRTYCETHKKLIKLPFIGYVTTNYDELLEFAITDSCRENELTSYGRNGFSISDNVDGELIHKFFMNMSSNCSYDKSVAHLHGCVQDIHSIILSEDEYEHAYGKDKDLTWTIHKKFLWSLLCTRRLLFIGFGLEEEALNIILGQVSDDLWLWDSDVHYALFNIDINNDKQQVKIITKAKELKNRYGIVSIFYPSNESDHSKLEYLIEFIYKSTQKEVKIEKEMSIINNEVISDEPNDEIDWILDVNKKMM